MALSSGFDASCAGAFGKPTEIALEKNEHLYPQFTSSSKHSQTPIIQMA
jgi:hypothetical protein